MREIDVRCAVCGTLCRKAELKGASAFGPPDLDLRPQGPARWTLDLQVQRCGTCGYCARSLGKIPPGVGCLLESVVYLDVLKRSKLPRLARSFFCAALVEEAAGEPEAAGWRFLEAAWACDDRDARDQARICRERSAEMFERAFELGDIEPPPAVIQTLAAELWRRAGRFDEALDACDAAERELGADGSADDEDGKSGTAAIVAFLRDLASAGDDSARNSAEAFAGGDE